MDDPSTKPPAGIMITPMHADHLDALADLESMAFSIPWSYDALAEELQNPLAVFYVAEDVDAESAVGYIGMHHILDEALSPISSCTPPAAGRALRPASCRR